LTPRPRLVRVVRVLSRWGGGGRWAFRLSIRRLWLRRLGLRRSRSLHWNPVGRGFGLVVVAGGSALGCLMLVPIRSLSGLV
ncbi:MAG: hypothetical protein ACRDTH_11135, partial [Pseudonocardiaceae bacterium]